MLITKHICRLKQTKVVHFSISFNRLYSRDSINMTTLSSIEKKTTFTDSLPPDSKVPSVDESKQAQESNPRLLRQARIIDKGFFTWLTPEWYDSKDKVESRLVGVSPAAVRDLGLRPDIDQDGVDTLFAKTLAGKHIFEGTYPWAQVYSGYQFGQFAGQLGDGRVVSLFEAVNPETGATYELQLKGAGLTPYSRFADGKAVLRSSIRESLGSEAANALGIPSTRALALTVLPETNARRERIESCAMVCRMAPTWIRFGNFDYARTKGKTHVIQLAKYCIENVYKKEWAQVQDSGGLDMSKTTPYRWLYDQIVKKTAESTAMWQAYGFLNGVLNTDNMSVYGLALDYGPFAFMETFDKMYTPNHDDAMGRYSFRATPSATLWNLIRLGEAFGELLAVTSKEIEEGYETKSHEELGWDEAKQKQLLDDAAEYIGKWIDEYETLLKTKYTSIMCKRLGFDSELPSDHDDILSPLLDTLQDCELDYNLFFRRLADFKFDTSEEELPSIDCFFPREASATVWPMSQQMVKNWLLLYYNRLRAAGIADENEQRKARMNRVNPKFVLRNWILDEVIKDAQAGDFTLYNNIMKMAIEPFNDTWGLDPAEEQRLTIETKPMYRNAQCSCSS